MQLNEEVVSGTYSQFINSTKVRKSYAFLNSAYFLGTQKLHICIAQVRIAMLKEKHCYNSSTPNLPSLRLDLFRDPQTFYRF